MINVIRINIKCLLDITRNDIIANNIQIETQYYPEHKTKLELKYSNFL